MLKRSLVTRLVPLAALLLVGTDVLEAQACLGLANPAGTSRLMSATASGTDVGRSVTARYGMTGDRVFGGVQLGAAGGKFAKLQSPVVGGDVGTILPFGTSGATQLCPVVQMSFQNGPQSSSTVQSRLASTVGLSLGRAYSLTGTMKFIPFVQGGAQYVRQRYGYTSLGMGQDGDALPGAWGHTSTVLGETAAGFGLKVNERLTLTPRYSVPIGQADRAGVYQQTYSLGVTLGIPR